MSEETMLHGAAAAVSAKPTRIWPVQVTALCQDILETISTMRSAHRVGAFTATETELLDMSGDLQRVASCAHQLGTEFKNAAHALRGGAR